MQAKWNQFLTNLEMPENGPDRDAAPSSVGARPKVGPVERDKLKDTKGILSTTDYEAKNPVSKANDAIYRRVLREKVPPKDAVDNVGTAIVGATSEKAKQGAAGALEARAESKGVSRPAIDLSKKLAFGIGNREVKLDVGSSGPQIALATDTGDKFTRYATFTMKDITAGVTLKDINLGTGFKGNVDLKAVAAKGESGFEDGTVTFDMDYTIIQTNSKGNRVSIAGASQFIVPADGQKPVWATGLEFKMRI